MLPPLNLPAGCDRDHVQVLTDEYIKLLNDTMQASAAEASCIPKHRSKPKPYWCPELSRLRDKKRFWWSMWVMNDRPREGEAYKCYKGVKKLFRQVSRNNIANMSRRKYVSLNTMYVQKNMCAFWNTIEGIQRKNVNSTLTAQEFGNYYSDVMNDRYPLSKEQSEIESVVKARFYENQYYTQHVKVTPERVGELIDSLKKNSAPGADGISAEYLILGKSLDLCSHLASIYSIILSWNIVPHVFQTGVVIPILKKASLNPNEPSNYQPITLSSVHSKLIENLMIPADNVSDCQFGFRTKRGTSFGCALLNDIMHYFNDQGSPLYVCSLDAEKCFDRIWHAGLMFKLWDVLPLAHWLLLYRWYTTISARVKWNSVYRNVFGIDQGVHQGSVLSPYLFNIFIYGMLKEVQE
jgi:hypothetical protein